MANSSDCGDVLMERSISTAGERMHKLINMRSSKNTLLKVDGEAVEAAEVKNINTCGQRICYER